MSSLKEVWAFLDNNKDRADVDYVRIHNLFGNMDRVLIEEVLIYALQNIIQGRLSEALEDYKRREDSRQLGDGREGKASGQSSISREA